VAYQTSGNIAVFDDDAVRFVDFVSDYNGLFKMDHKEAEDMLSKVKQFLDKKKPGQVDSDEIIQIKGLIRRGEAKAAGRYCGVPEEQLHFLDMPFYETGRVKKKPLSQDDIDLIVDSLRKV